MKFNYFQDNLAEGNICEEQVKARFKEIFTPVLNHILYEENPGIQKRGIDFFIDTRPIAFDVKCRRYATYKYGDILLETVSIKEREKPGWVWSSESDIIVYVWKNRTGTKFVDGYLLFLKDIRKWIHSVGVDRFKKIISRSVGKGGNVWSTENIAIPIESFPANCLQKINLSDFSPQEQSVLNEWFE